MVPTSVILFWRSCFASAADVKKLSVVMLEPLYQRGSESFITTCFPSASTLSSSRPRYGIIWKQYFESTSARIQNFMPNLSGFKGRYCVNGFCGEQLLVGCHLGTRTVATLAVLVEMIEYSRYHCKLSIWRFCRRWSWKSK